MRYFPQPRICFFSPHLLARLHIRARFTASKRNSSVRIRTYCRQSTCVCRCSAAVDLSTWQWLIKAGQGPGACMRTFLTCLWRGKLCLAPAQSRSPNQRASCRQTWVAAPPAGGGEVTWHLGHSRAGFQCRRAPLARRHGAAEECAPEERPPIQSACGCPGPPPPCSLCPALLEHAAALKSKYS